MYVYVLHLHESIHVYVFDSVYLYVSIYVCVLSVYIHRLVFWFIRRQANLRKYIAHVYNWFEKNELSNTFWAIYIWYLSINVFVCFRRITGIKRNWLWTVFQEFRHHPSLVINYDLYVFWSESVSCSVVSLCNPINCTLPGSSVHGILEARILEWIAILFSRGTFPLRD